MRTNGEDTLFLGKEDGKSLVSIHYFSAMANFKKHAHLLRHKGSACEQQ